MVVLTAIEVLSSVEDAAVVADALLVRLRLHTAMLWIIQESLDYWGQVFLRTGSGHVSNLNVRRGRSLLKMGSRYLLLLL